MLDRNELFYYYVVLWFEIGINKDCYMDTKVV